MDGHYSFSHRPHFIQLPSGPFDSSSDSACLKQVLLVLHTLVRCLSSHCPVPQAIILLRHNLFNKPNVDGHLGGLHFFTIVNSSPVNNFVHFSFFMYKTDQFPAMRLLGQRVNIYNLERDCQIAVHEIESVCLPASGV